MTHVTVEDDIAYLEHEARFPACYSQDYDYERELSRQGMGVSPYCRLCEAPLTNSKYDTCARCYYTHKNQ